MAEFDELLARLTKTEAPCPSMLVLAVGYTGDARFVALHWGGGDEVYYDDGIVSATGFDQPYLLYVRHNAVWPHLVGRTFGSSDEEATHWLLIDREAGAIYTGRVRDVHRVLLAQHPQEMSGDSADTVGEVFAGADWGEAVAAFMADFRARTEAWNALPGEEQMRIVRARMAEERERYREFDAWLSQQGPSRAEALLKEWHASCNNRSRTARRHRRRSGSASRQQPMYAQRTEACDRVLSE